MWFGYYWLPLKEGDKVKTTFWGTNVHGKDQGKDHHMCSQAIRSQLVTNHFWSK